MNSKFLLYFALVLSGGWFICWFAASQLFQDYRLAEFPSPANPASEAWFMDGGIVDRNLIFLAKVERKKPLELANLCWFPNCDFSSAQWSKDGQIIVCSVKAKATGERPIMVVAFDFSKRQSVSPLWMTVSGFSNPPEREWRKQESAIEELVAAHGGLSGQRIDNDMIVSKEKMLWFWQVPKL